MNAPPVEPKTSKIIPAKIICFINDYINLGRLAKVDVEGSSPFSRSKNFKPDGEFLVGLFSFSAVLIKSARLMKRRLTFSRFGEVHFDPLATPELTRRARLR